MDFIVIRTIFFQLILVSFVFCGSMERAAVAQENEASAKAEVKEDFKQLSAFVRRIFQDSNGNLWFGTNGDGAFQYDGQKLSQFSLEDGFGGAAVRGIVEDKEGNVWFGTERLTKSGP